MNCLRYDFGCDQVTAFSTERGGGVSVGNYASFNANAFCGDNPAHVAQNRQLLAESLGIPAAHIIIPHQTHGTQTRHVSDAFLALPEAERRELLEGIDALMTTERGICLCVSTADCIPVLLFDPVRRAIATIHAGWRGTQQRIVQSTIEAMRQAFGTRAEDLQAAIGPGIAMPSFEVGDEVYEAFRQANFPMESIAARMPNPATGETKWHIDLFAANQLQLTEKGVDVRHIRLANIDTFTHSDRFFSARRLGIHSGRILTGILLND